MAFKLSSVIFEASDSFSLVFQHVSVARRADACVVPIGPQAERVILELGDRSPCYPLRPSNDHDLIFGLKILISLRFTEAQC
jgi:hypothetical protein